MTPPSVTEYAHLIAAARGGWDMHEVAERVAGDRDVSDKDRYRLQLLFGARMREIFGSRLWGGTR